MDQNFDLGPGFWAMVQNGPEMGSNGPKRKKSNYSHSFQGMKLIFQDDVDPPKALKIMEQNFDRGPSFRAMAQIGPKMAQNGKSLTTPTVFKV